MYDSPPGSERQEPRSTQRMPGTVIAAGVLGLLSAGAYLIDSIPGDLWYYRPFTSVVLPLVLAALVVSLWVRPGTRQVGRVVFQYVIALVCFQASMLLGLPFLIASTVCLFLPSSKTYYRSRADR
ncbi:hypothetical protein [Promicromonospora sp. NPDC023987]|uniref:hypothetical protein n=1 Tax=Promicromonospora sp. NPDC023987 TaxID=3155360 RepID=UPI0033F65141